MHIGGIEMDTSQIEQLVNEQKVFFETHSTYSLIFRKQMLLKLKTAIQKYEQQFYEAVKKDLGKSPTETYMCELGLIYKEFDYLEKKLRPIGGASKDENAVVSFFGSQRNST